MPLSGKNLKSLQVKSFLSMRTGKILFSNYMQNICQEVYKLIIAGFVLELKLLAAK